MGALRDRMVADIRLRGLSQATEVQYPRRVAALAGYFRRSPAELRAGEVQAFVLHLVAERKLSAASVCAYIAAFKFFYEVTVKRPEVAASLVYPKKARRLPDVMGRTEVDWLLACVSH